MQAGEAGLAASPTGRLSRPQAQPWPLEPPRRG